MIYNAEELILYCKDNNKSIADIVLEDEIKSSGETEEIIIEKLLNMLEVMEQSAKKFLEVESVTNLGMIDGFAKKANDYALKDEGLLSKENIQAMAMAFSTLEFSSSMGKIVASPTAGSSGIIPAAIFRYKATNKDVDNRKLVDALLTSVGIGQIIGRYANFAGAEGGCQAECGSASAMASAALVFLKGGSIEEILNAASITLVNILGLVCDPIAGLVEYPCTFRNASGVINAILSADLALAGIKSLVPFEEVTQAMNEVGKSMSYTLKETSLGGLAATKTGEKIKKEFYGE
ncbi:L-serine ammonia-lyase, iron-sulfur-dependent, subunit alpha [Miniphocaeibacter halophilus]|uniref:L-serine ammonia-lyase, iron-sulfur-dependent, subunit alpha n=1 Tax=Miniphocaeibacter halophilus TaxID=2931922 RepID=A0AC61MTB7_9FIRM|nr:L-serine ammonia-lyase, iron-sulfur-dependent, subunit alpha [Miniphocaeibacter halophilus]QQK07481.1 L-serine ammonia-lyase, iron-sulfur-dependent, subunit alpha [Miniphocaeibacter halophilus]